MRYPKIVFKPMSLKDNIEFINWAYFEEDGILSVHDYTIKLFPDLANIDSNLPHEDVYKIIERVVTNEYNKNKDIIINTIENYNSLWNKYNDEYFEALSLYLDINWPDNITKIKATVGLIPVFPRYLDDFSFSVGIGVNDGKLIETCAHETLHFLWFEKWKQMYPETLRKEYDTPYLVWQYSEMVADPILNSKSINKILKVKCKSYEKFYSIKDKNKYVMDVLIDIYNKKDQIENKIRKGYNYIREIFKDKE